MIGDIGRAAAFVAFALAVYAIGAGLAAGLLRRSVLLESARRAVYAQMVFVTITMGALIVAMVTKDYSIKFVANYTSNETPLNFAITGFWAGNAGSLLLWVFILTVFSTLVAIQTRRRNAEFAPFIIATQAITAAFFLAMMNFVTPTFERMNDVVTDGIGLNPALENFWMQIHPPSLYMGYITMSVPFAYAVAALISRRLGDEWLRAAQRWTLLGWTFLSVGNLLGSRWAYETLGWGGFWGWDPVENAAILPWFTATAFLHSVMIQERRGMLKVWNLTLILATYCLAIFGTFLVRSGILVSVHSFNVSALGPYFFGFLALVILGSLGLIVWRLGDLRSEGQFDSLLSRESMFLLNNLLLVGSAFAIFWGTIYPLITEATRGVKITVGAPYFDQVVGPILLSLFLLMGIGPLIAWRRATVANLVRNFRWPIGYGVVSLIAVLALGYRETPTLLAAPVLGFVIGGILIEFYRGVRARVRGYGEAIPTAFLRLFSRSRSRYGGYVVHVGMVLIAVGVIGTKVYQTGGEATIAQGEAARIGPYALTYVVLDQRDSPTREIDAVTLRVAKDGRDVGTLVAQKNFFKVQQQSQTVVGLRQTLTEDLYVVLANVQPPSRAADTTTPTQPAASPPITLKLYVNPLVAWLWIGGAVLLIGAFICFWPDARKEKLTARREGREQVLAGTRS